MDALTLSRAMGGALPLQRYAALTPAFNKALIDAGCTTVARVAMFCAQVGTESGGLAWMQELASGHEYEGRRDLGNTQPGDGVKYKGHGPIQITGRANHAAVSRWAYGRGLVPTPTYFVDNPAELAGDEFGFLGAVWYWTVARNMNSYADARNIVGATRAVNGGLNGLASRTARWTRCLALGNALLPDPNVFPLPAGNWFGLDDGTVYSHSGARIEDVDAIKRIQTAVGVTADGSIGPLTDTAIKAYQTAHNLEADGKVGPATWHAIVGA